MGARFEITTAGTSKQVKTAQQITISGLSPLPIIGAGEVVILPGFDVAVRPPRELIRWLRRLSEWEATVCAICTGAFALGDAGLLNRRSCTTHWKRLDQLQQRFPEARVLRDRLFVTDGLVTTSAGVASGIDVALWFVERYYGPLLAARVAREMVVHVRRDGSQSQESAYLDGRMHVNSGVHLVQDHFNCAQGPENQFA